MKILTLCEGGNVRSVAASYLLKQQFKHDSISASILFNSPDTLTMLCEWAEKIIVMYKEAAGKVPEKYRPKLVLMHVGEDRYGNAFNPELLGYVGSMLQEWLNAGSPSGVSNKKLVAYQPLALAERVVTGEIKS